MVSNDDVCVCTLMKDDDHDDDMQLYCFYIYWAIYFLLFTFYLGDALYYYHHHHHHQKALRNKSQTSHGQRPGLKRNKKKQKQSKMINYELRYSLINYRYYIKGSNSLAPSTISAPIGLFMATFGQFHSRLR